MSKEETINWLQSYLEYPEMDNPEYIKQAIQSLINLYNKEKEKNKELEDELEDWKFTTKYVENNYISKDKIKEKIEEYKEILQSSIIKEDYKKEVEHIIRVLKELRGEN